MRLTVSVLFLAGSVAWAAPSIAQGPPPSKASAPQTSTAGKASELAPAKRPPQLTLMDPMSTGAQLANIQVSTTISGVNVYTNGNARQLSLDHSRMYGTCSPGEVLGGSIGVSFYSNKASLPLDGSYFVGVDVVNSVANGDWVITRGDHDPGGVEIKRCPVTAGAQRCLAEVTMPGSTTIRIRHWTPSGYIGQVNTPIVKSIIFGTP